MKELIYKDTARRIIDSPRTKEQMLAMLELIEPVEPERKTGKWQKLHGYATPGGDPVWCCSECGKGIHVFGVEHNSYGKDIADHQWLSCPNCDTRMVGEEERRIYVRNVKT